MGSGYGEFARQATKLLSKEGAGRVRDYVLSRRLPEGGFRGRAAEADLYYTYFGLMALHALGEAAEPARSAAYVAALRVDGMPDLVSLAALSRAHKLCGILDRDRAEAICLELEKYRTADGGYSLTRGGAQCSTYACFLASLAYEAVSRSPPEPAGMVRAVLAHSCPSGGFGELAADAAVVSVTAAAVSCLSGLNGWHDGSKTGGWIRSHFRSAEGGFAATREAPCADLLSTATALYALRILAGKRGTAACDVPCSERSCQPGAPCPTGQAFPASDPFPQGLVEPVAGFVSGLWRDDGGFSGTAADPVTDVEYTFYALLALGGLAGGVE